ncbi:MAG: MerC family mercury resistance protein [Candidatus Omnitrophica bacterium]|nr:MerC family mercury resistance protein [Candidatus Omnitrophota bacterium]
MKANIVEKIGNIGSFLAALACPACFGSLAAVGAALGLGIFQRFEGAIAQLFQVLVVTALAGNVIVYFTHRNKIALVIGVASPLLILSSFYLWFEPAVLYAGLFGLLLAALANTLAKSRCKSCRISPITVERKSIIKCPHCGFEKEEVMPTEACQYYYVCTNCHKKLKPKQGDCCVFCSYGSVKCPSKQTSER